MDDNSQKKLNFIIIISDTLRRDFLGCYGNNWMHTEHINAFAKKSLIFDNAYSASFPTVPHRHDVFTGCYTASYIPWAPLPEIEPVLQEQFRGRGYTTMMICDEPHILENGFNYQRGFDGFDWIRGQEHDRWVTSPKSPPFKCDPKKIRNPSGLQNYHMRVRSHWRYEEDTFPGRTATATCRWLEENHKNGPFYLYVDFFDPHEPWDAPQWYIDMYDPGYDGEIVDYPLYAKWKEFLSDKELKHCRALYAAEVTLIDRWVGRIFDKCQDLGLMENTVILFTTDHGFLLGEHGFIGKSLIRGQHYDGVLSYLPLYEEINHIPFILYHPNGKKGRTNARVQPPDIMPTILDLQGQPWLASHGESFKEVILGNKETHRDFTMSFPFLKVAGAPISFVKDNYAAIFFSKVDKNKGKLPSDDKAVDGIKKTIEPWEFAKDMLFDLKSDPTQEHDLAEKHPEILQQYHPQMIKFLQDIDTDEDIIARFKH